MISLAFNVSKNAHLKQMYFFPSIAFPWTRVSQTFLFCSRNTLSKKKIRITNLPRISMDFPPTQQRLHMTRITLFYFYFLSFHFFFYFLVSLKRCCNHAHSFLKISSYLDCMPQRLSFCCLFLFLSAF